MPTHRALVTVQFWMIQCFPIRGPIVPICTSRPGGCQFSAECIRWKPSTVMYFSPEVAGKNTLGRTVISASLLFGAAGEVQCIGIVIAEEVAGQLDLPDAASLVDPRRNPLGTFDEHLFAGSSPIGDALRFNAAAESRLD